MQRVRIASIPIDSVLPDDKVCCHLYAEFAKTSPAPPGSSSAAWRMAATVEVATRFAIPVANPHSHQQTSAMVKFAPVAITIAERVFPSAIQFAALSDCGLGEPNTKSLT